MMKKSAFSVFFPVLILVLCACSPGTDQKMTWKAPSGLKLPVELSPSSSAAWRESGGGFILSSRTPGVIEVPAWWTGNRPPAGDMVVLEVSYRDSVTEPVRAEVFSGMGSESSFSELHRFGGTGDGSWKVARVPCPWDLTLLSLPSKTMRIRLISRGGDLEIKSLRLTGPEPGDENSYNEQTREWVHRVQSRAQTDPDYYKLAQAPVLDERWAKSPLVVFKHTWMDPVLPISAPQKGETDFPVSVRMALNEYEPVQLGIYANGRDLAGVEVAVDPIRNAGGSVMASARVRVAGYSLVKSRIPGYQVEPFPQCLWPAYRFDIPAGRSHLVWIELQTSGQTARAGSYKTSVRIKASGLEEIAVPLEVEILPYSLLTMDEAGLQLGGHILGLVSEHDLAFQRRYNHNHAGLWYGGVHPRLSKQDDSFDMDFRIMDDWMAAATRQGFKSIYYFLGGNPYGFPQTMDLEKDLARTVFSLGNDGWQTLAMENPDSVNPKLAPLYTEWARKLGEHARAAGWIQVVPTPFDEPAKWIQSPPNIGPLSYIKPHFIHSAELLRKGWPEAQICADIHHYKGGIDFLPYLDIFCTNATHENLEMPDMVRAAGKIFWEFFGCDDKGLPSRARYTLGFYFAAHDSRASQLWAYNWGGRFDTLDGENWLYAWYTPFDVIPSPYMEGVREGMDERRLMETLKRRAQEKNVDLSAFFNSLWEEVAAKAATLRSRNLTPETFWDGTEELGVMDTWHDRLVEKLLSLE